jgi:hypothetical protein
VGESNRPDYCQPLGNALASAVSCQPKYRNRKQFVLTLLLASGIDYGDNWQFKVVLENVEPGRSKLKRPRILASADKSPQPHPDWDE